ncbi:hypothetical protein AVEN_38101-1 [Araneus ventricosus]|uniref:Uncharacterized protein n=1 Tax=Araneus ventricosus TaxID=182803 RepID=A0A4Y2G9M3_ARAVE|nr:hypothetical protein AVEN_38101-1 [Araneus ventricosus]
MRKGRRDDQAQQYYYLYKMANASLARFQKYSFCHIHRQEENLTEIDFQHPISTCLICLLNQRFLLIFKQRKYEDHSQLDRIGYDSKEGKDRFLWEAPLLRTPYQHAQLRKLKASENKEE